MLVTTLRSRDRQVAFLQFPRGIRKLVVQKHLLASFVVVVDDALLHVRLKILLAILLVEKSSPEKLRTIRHCIEESYVLVVHLIENLLLCALLHQTDLIFLFLTHPIHLILLLALELLEIFLALLMHELLLFQSIQLVLLLVLQVVPQYLLVLDLLPLLGIPHCLSLSLHHVGMVLLVVPEEVSLVSLVHNALLRNGKRISSE